VYSLREIRQGTLFSLACAGAGLAIVGPIVGLVAPLCCVHPFVLAIILGLGFCFIIGLVVVSKLDRNGSIDVETIFFSSKKPDDR
jgi:hypothetical protein